MIAKIVKILKRILPGFLYNGIKVVYKWLKSISKPLYNIYFNIKLKKVQANHKKALEILRKKEKIKVAFFMLNTDTWKYDSVYKHFDTTQRFVPVVIICPFINKGDEFLKNELEKSIGYCKKMKYDYILGYSIEKQEPIDIKSSVKPDIVFFSNPNKLTTKEFLISNYLDTLSCYVPYSFRIDSLYNYNYNNNLTNLTWKNFYETPFHKNFASKYARNKGLNVVVTGHPHLDKLLISDKTKIEDPWKNIDSKKRKRIIWGPHWTIKGYQNTGLDWSCFLDYADYFSELAHEFRDHVQFALKPHPFLRITLEKEELWGGNKTSKYYREWEENQNMQLVEGDYLNLFKHSDALIHDSGAFMAEYLLLNKPTAYTINNDEVFDKLNEFGISALNVHTKITTKQELKSFVLEVISGKDKMKSYRSDFVKTHFDLNGISASEKIVNNIIRSL